MGNGCFTCAHVVFGAKIWNPSLYVFLIRLSTHDTVLVTPPRCSALSSSLKSGVFYNLQYFGGKKYL